MRDELRELVARHSVEGSVALPVPRLTLHRSARPTEPVQVLYRPALCVVLQGGKRAILGTRVFTYDPDSYLVLSVELPLTSAVVEADRKRPYLGMSLALERSILSPLILEVSGAEPVRPLSAGLTQSPLGPDLLDPLLRLMRLMDSPGDVDFLAPLIEREILFRVLRGPQASVLRQIATAGGRAARIERATTWIKEHHAEPIRIEALAELASMSLSSFHQHFKTLTTMSPVKYQKGIRLQEARRLMMSGQFDMTRIGFAVGYGSPSQFSREYRNAFGATPAQDAVRLRSGGGRSGAGLDGVPR
jgi:AraC-like DNA-binding protein